MPHFLYGKVALKHYVMKAHVGRRGGTAWPLLASALDGMSGQFQACDALPSRRETPVPTGQVVGQTQGRSGHCGEKKNLALSEVKSGPCSP
jgi:hypothetical protein